MERLTRQQAVVVSAYTGCLSGDVMRELHRYIEEKLGRPVLSHQLANGDVWDEIKEAVREDFLAICYADEVEESNAPE